MARLSGQKPQNSAIFASADPHQLNAPDRPDRRHLHALAQPENAKTFAATPWRDTARRTIATRLTRSSDFPSPGIFTFTWSKGTAISGCSVQPLCNHSATINLMRYNDKEKRLHGCRNLPRVMCARLRAAVRAHHARQNRATAATTRKIQGKEDDGGCRMVAKRLHAATTRTCNLPTIWRRQFHGPATGRGQQVIAPAAIARQPRQSATFAGHLVD